MFYTRHKQRLVSGCGDWNPICALTLCTDGDSLLSSSPFARDLAWGLMMEVVELARTIGIPGENEKTAKKLIIAKRKLHQNTNLSHQ